MFAIESIAGFFPFMDYWPSKNVSRDHGTKCEFFSLAKSIVIESIVDFSPFRRYWTSNGSRDHDVKKNLLIMQNV